MKIFIACPITKRLAPVAGGGEPLLEPGLRSLLEALEEALLREGHQVFIAARREEFGRRLFPPELCTPLDFLEMQTADIVVAFPEESYGVHIELGWASALNKPIVLLKRKSDALRTPLSAGLGTIGRVQIIETADDLLADAGAQRALGKELARAVSRGAPRAGRVPPSFAFVSTSFGFGPASKAVALARELKRRDPAVRADFMGVGVDHDFARKSEVFDRVVKVDVDDPDVLKMLVPHLMQYDATFSVINHALVPLWAPAARPLYLVDSLAWLWREPPAGLENVRTYYMQDYLVPRARIEAWADRCDVRLVGPIESASAYQAQRRCPRARANRLLVSFSGCANPVIPRDFYVDYVDCLARLVVEEGRGRFEEIVFCCNADLARHIGACFPGDPSIRCGHYAHEEFISLLASSEFILSSPGITTTLEALALGTPQRFLLPQNYSQALISERYLEVLGQRACMALSRFGADLAVAPDVAEDVGVEMVARALCAILRDRRREVREMLRDMLSSPGQSYEEALRRQSSARWTVSGQEAIINEVLADARR